MTMIRINCPHLMLSDGIQPGEGGKNQDAVDGVVGHQESLSRLEHLDNLGRGSGARLERRSDEHAAQEGIAHTRIAEIVADLLPEGSKWDW